MPSFSNNAQDLRPKRSLFDLSESSVYDCGFGQLIPAWHRTMVAGDLFKIGASGVVRFMPMLAPIYTSIHITAHTFFVPFRLLWSDWEKFFTQSEGSEGLTVPCINRGQWESTMSNINSSFTPTDHGDSLLAIGSLWDYFGFSSPAKYTDLPNHPGDLPDGSLIVTQWPWLAYNMIYNEYYRQQDVMSEVPLLNPYVLRRCWAKDYFTASLPKRSDDKYRKLQLKGMLDFEASPKALHPDAHAVPLSGLKADMHNIDGVDEFFWKYHNSNGTIGFHNSNTKKFVQAFEKNVKADTTFNLDTIRTAFAMLGWHERTVRSGSRYTEYLKAHFGVAPADGTLQRPEYVGGCKFPVVVSEVLQTSSPRASSPSNEGKIVNPLGDMAGHGMAVNGDYMGSWHAKEPGICMTLVSVMPEASYSQGIDREYTYTDIFDHYFAEFAHLPEQAVKTSELYNSNLSTAPEVLGYTGIYDNLRTGKNRFKGKMRDELDYWHMGRHFNSHPKLSKSFLECNPSLRSFAFSDEILNPLMINWHTGVKAIRPIPRVSIPSTGGF